MSVASKNKLFTLLQHYNLFIIESFNGKKIVLNTLKSVYYNKVFLMEKIKIIWGGGGNREKF